MKKNISRCLYGRIGLNASVMGIVMKLTKNWRATQELERSRKKFTIQTRLETLLVICFLLFFALLIPSVAFLFTLVSVKRKSISGLRCSFTIVAATKCMKNTQTIKTHCNKQVVNRKKNEKKRKEKRNLLQSPSRVQNSLSFAFKTHGNKPLQTEF